MAVPVNSEDQIGKKFDKCLTDGVIKFGGGIVLGAVFSLLFFKRRRWPILMGSGIGIGMAYRSCEMSVNELFSSSSKTDPSTGQLIVAKKDK